MCKYVVLITALAASWVFAYWLGTTKAEIQYIIKEKEVVRYEKNCATGLLGQPNIDDDAIIRLFDSNQL